MKLVNLLPLKEIDFPNKKAFDVYNKQHKLRPDTKVNIGGKKTTVGQISKNSTINVFNNTKYDTSGKTDYFEEYDKLPDNIKDLMDKHFGSGDDEYDYKELQSIQKDFEANGWTFDFGLDAIPYELKPIKKSGK